MRIQVRGSTPKGYVLGNVDAFVTHPDGKTFFRVNDRWFPADMCELVEW